MASLELPDVEEIVRLVAAAGDPTTDVPLPERKRSLLQGVARLIDADAWLWSSAVANPDVLGDAMTTCLIDGGWRDEQERMRVVETLTTPRFAELTGIPIVEASRRNHFSTLLLRDLVPVDRQEHFVALWHPTGFNYVMIAVYPLGGDQFSGVGFHRRLGKTDFTDRERLIVQVVLLQVDWLHRHGANSAAQDKVMQLSPRERQVLILLLSGDSRKEIARKLTISEHTLGDYIKQLHKHFAVRSRAELQAFFLVGERSA